MVEKYHRENPDKPRYGIKDISGKLLDIDSLEDDEHTQHIIYAVWYLNNGNGYACWLSPTTNQLIDIIDQFEFYATPLLKGHADYSRQLDFIKDIDNLEAEGISASGWDDSKWR